MRRWGVTRDGASLWWPAIAQQALDRPRPPPGPGPRLVALLAEQCDVVLENFRPGTLERVGPRLRRAVGRNPALVMVHISGFGQTGPLAGQAGFGSVGEAMGGIRYTTGSPDRPPSRPASASATRWRRCSACGHAVGAGGGRATASARRSTWRSTRPWRR